MEKKKKTSSEVIKNIFSNDADDSKIVEKLEELLPIDKHDYEGSETYYDEYVKILYKLAVCEEDKLEKLKEEIEDNNPWKEALEDSKQYRSIADSDRSILEPLIEEEINSFEDNIISEKMRKFLNKDLRKIYSPFGGKSKFNDVVKNTIATPFFNQLFSDFEHAFDGNFENPRVVILGINPKLSNIKHKRFNLQRVYNKPFNSRRNTLFSNNLKNDEYYFVDNGFFFSKNDNDASNNIIKDIFLDKVNNSKIDTPYCLWEFFPYATTSENEWYDGIEISTKVKKYLELKKILPSQIWLLCILTYTLRKIILEKNKEERVMYIFLTKTNKTFIDKFFKPYLKLVNIQNRTNIIILTKNNNQNRNFHWNNIKEYKKEKMNFASVEDFFGKIWGIPRIEDFFEKIWGICGVTSFLNEVYQELIYGISEKSLPIKTFAENYNKKYQTKEEACKRMMQDQINKCTTAGVIDGIVTSITVPNNIPKNIANVLYGQLQMIACTAYMAGYDLNRTETKTFIYECLAGVAVNEILEKFGDRFATNFAIKNDINLEAAVFGDSAVSKTESIANRAYKWFFENKLELNDDTEEDIIIKAEDRLDD